MRVGPTSEPEVYFRDAGDIRKHRGRIWWSSVLGALGVSLVAVAATAGGIDSVTMAWRMRLGYVMGLRDALYGASALLLPLAWISFAAMSMRP